MKFPTIGECAWCGKEFVWDRAGRAKMFCGKNHAEAARCSRKRLRSHLHDGVCATPNKRGYLTLDAGIAVYVKAPWDHRGLYAYECSCGMWHLGHVVKGVHAAAVVPRA